MRWRRRLFPWGHASVTPELLEKLDLKQQKHFNRKKQTTHGDPWAERIFCAKACEDLTVRCCCRILKRHNSNFVRWLDELVAFDERDATHDLLSDAIHVAFENQDGYPVATWLAPAIRQPWINDVSRYRITNPDIL